MKKTKIQTKHFSESKPAIAGGKPVRKKFLSYFLPSIGKEEITEVVDTLKSNWITTGPKTQKFEELFQKYIGCKYAVAVNSCTAAMHLALVAAEIGEGDEVITTPFTFAATANVILHCGAKPVFVDIEKETYDIDTGKIEKAISKKTKAIMPVHYAGHPCEMDKIMKIAKKYKLIVIEDAAHAVGTIYKGRKIGTIGDFTAFSFYATKNMTTAEGGMLTTNKKGWADKVRILGLHGMSRDAWKRYFPEASWRYEILYPGYKYNMTDIQASLGIHQLKKLEGFIKERNKIARIYNEAFRDVPEIITPKTKKYVRHAWYIYPILLNLELLKIDRDKFMDALAAENIGRSVHFLPLHLQPYYQKKFGFKRGDFPISEYIGDRTLSLPLYPKMNRRDVEDVISAVKKIVNYFRK